MITNKNYDEILETFKKNQKDSKILIDSIFSDLGVQGVVGLAKIKKNNEISNPCIFKLSKSEDYVVNHEYNILKDLSEISSVAPFFPRPIGLIKSKINFDALNKKQDYKNIFKLNSDSITERKTILLMEYFDESYSLFETIRQSEVSTIAIINCIKLLLIVISLVQKRLNFCHNDLHTGNVLVRKCDPNLILNIDLDENTSVAIPTYGIYPVIIDFGYAYSKGIEKKAFMCPLWSFGIYDPTQYLPLVDVFKMVVFSSKLLNATMRKNNFVERWKLEIDKIFYEVEKIQKKEDSYINSIGEENGIGLQSRFKQLIKNNLNVDISNFKNVIRHFNDIFYLLQSLIVLPLTPIPNNIIDPLELETSIVFLNEFLKFFTPNTLPIFLKNIIEYARKVRILFFNIETTNEAINIFSKDTIQLIENYNEIYKNNTRKIFTNLIKDFNKFYFKGLLVSLYYLSLQLENFLFSDRNISTAYAYSSKWNKIPFKDSFDIFLHLDHLFPSFYEVNNQTSVTFINFTINKQYNLPLRNTQIFKQNYGKYKSLFIGKKLHSLLD